MLFVHFVQHIKSCNMAQLQTVMVYIIMSFGRLNLPTNQHVLTTPPKKKPVFEHIIQE